MVPEIKKKLTEQSNSEIDVIILFQHYWRYKWAAFLSIFLITSLSIGYAFYKTPMYHVKGIIEIGSFGGVLVEKPSKFISEVDILNNRILSDAVIDRLISIDLIPNSVNLIELKTQGFSNADAEGLLDKIISNVKADHEEVIQNHLQLYDGKLAQAKKEYDRLKNEKSKLSIQLSSYQESVADILSENAAVAAVFALNLNSINQELSAINKRIYELDKEISTIKLALLPSKISRTKVLGQKIIQDNPAEPKRLLIITLGFVIGLLISLIVVLILSLRQKL